MGKLENDIRELEKELREKANEYDGLSDENCKNKCREEIKKMIMRLYVFENPTKTTEEIKMFENYVNHYLWFINMSCCIDTIIDNISAIRSEMRCNLNIKLAGFTNCFRQYAEGDRDHDCLANCTMFKKEIIECVELIIKHHYLTNSAEETLIIVTDLKSTPYNNGFIEKVYEKLSQLHKNRDEDEPSTGNPNR